MDYLFWMLTGESKNKIISDIANDRFIKECIHNITKGNYLKEDLMQELLLHLLEQPESKIQEMHHKEYVKYHCLDFLTKQYRSTSSDWFRKETRFKIRTKKIGNINDFLQEENINDSIQKESELNSKPTIKEDLEILTPQIRHYINNHLHWYSKLIFLKYIDEKKTIRTLSKEIGIPANTIWETINKVKYQIQQFIKVNKLIDEI